MSHTWPASLLQMSLSQLFSWYFFEIIQKSFFKEKLWVTASDKAKYAVSDQFYEKSASPA